MKDTTKENIMRGDTGLAVKVGFWYVVSNMLVKALSFITTPIFSRLMSPEAYGEFSNFASWRAIILILTGAELHQTLSRAYYDYKDDYDEYIFSVAITSGLLTVLLYIVFLLSGDSIYRVVAIPPKYVHVLFFTLFCTNFKSIFLARERTLYRYKTVATISVIDFLVPTAIAVIFVLLVCGEERLSARIYGFYMPSAIVGLACGINLLSRGKTFHISHCRYAIRLALPLLVHYLTAYLLTSTNTILAKSLLGAEIAAVVSIATSVIHILTVLFQSLSGAVTTWLMDNLEQSNYQRLHMGTLIYVGILAIVSVGVILLAPEIVWILGGVQYKQAVALIPGMTFAILLQSIGSIFTIILTYDKNVTRTAFATGIIAGLSIIAKFSTLPIFGIQSLPFINIVTYSALLIVNYLLVKKAGYGKVVDIKGILMIIVVAMLFLLASFTLYEHLYLRFLVLIIFVLFGLVFVYRKRVWLLAMIKKKNSSNNIE